MGVKVELEFKSKESFEKFKKSVEDSGEFINERIAEEEKKVEELEKEKKKNRKYIDNLMDFCENFPIIRRKE